MQHVNTLGSPWFGFEDKNVTRPREGYRLGNGLFPFISIMSEPLFPRCETGVWVKVSHNPKLLTELLTAVLSEHAATFMRGEAVCAVQQLA